jgi:hypothetical protein
LTSWLIKILHAKTAVQHLFLPKVSSSFTQKKALPMNLYAVKNAEVQRKLREMMAQEDKAEASATIEEEAARFPDSN